MDNPLIELNQIFQFTRSQNPFSDATRKAMSYEEDSFIKGLLARNTARYRLRLAKDLITALSIEETQRLIHDAIAGYAEQEKYHHDDILRDLAILRPEVFSAYYPALIDAGICDADGVIYHAADATISARLLTMMRTGDTANLSAEKLLCALAWIGDATVVAQWDAWRQESYRPENLYLDPYLYALNAGWELHDHQRRMVCFPTAAVLIPRRDVLAGHIEGPVATTLHDVAICQWCQGPLTVLFAVDLHDPRMAHLFELQGERLRILCCDSCTPMATTPIYFDFDLQGMAQWSERNPALHLERTSFEFPERSLILGERVPQPIEFYRTRTGNDGASYLGGFPLWVHDFSYHPVCPQCDRHMHFIGQADVADIVDGEGVFYGFACFICHISTSVYQQT